MKEDALKEKILGFFRRNTGSYISGEDISNALGVSRAYVWKYISKLREDGYVIDAVPHLGYNLRSAPDKLFGYELKSGLKTRTMGKMAIFHHESIGSTNDAAYELAEAGEPEGTVVVAEAQSSGKGRIGRKWLSPKGAGIYMSIILRPDVETDEIPTVTLVAAKSIADAINDLNKMDAGIKWPNDILIKGKKVCGILTEVKAQPDRVDFLVLGFGVNVNTPAGKLPEEGTSLKNVSGSSVDRAQLVRDILEKFEVDYLRFKKEGFNALRDECKRLSLVLEKTVRVKEHHRVMKGKAVDIDEKGALMIRDEEGIVRRVFSGDVVMCRR